MEKENKGLGASSLREDRAASPSDLSPSGSSRSGIPSAARKVDQRFKVNVEPYGYSFSPDAGMLRLCSHETSRGEKWWSGDFVDYRGIVSVMRERRFLRLDAVANNRCHTRSWRGYYGDRTVARLARAFLSDLLGEPAA